MEVGANNGIEGNLSEINVDFSDVNIKSRRNVSKKFGLFQWELPSSH